MTAFLNEVQLKKMERCGTDTGESTVLKEKWQGLVEYWKSRERGFWQIWSWISGLHNLMHGMLFSEVEKETEQERR